MYPISLRKNIIKNYIDRKKIIITKEKPRIRVLSDNQECSYSFLLFFIIKVAQIFLLDAWKEIRDKIK